MGNSILNSYTLKVWGDFACFTRPEMKVERVSYDVITPAAARAVFEAILWKPALRWQISQIEVLRPIRWVTLRRNELASVINTTNISTAMHGGNAGPEMFIEDDRQQRAGLFLKDVAYRLHAGLRLRDTGRRVRRSPRPPGAAAGGAGNSYAKYSEMFKRRARKGQCFNQPYLGAREFSCAFSLIEPAELEDEQRLHPAIADDKELGWMLYDMDFTDPDKPAPRFFQATMVSGGIAIPDRDSEAVRG